MGVVSGGAVKSMVPARPRVSWVPVLVMHNCPSMEAASLPAGLLVTVVY
jgi:hypothetical protein